MLTQAEATSFVEDTLQLKAAFDRRKEEPRYFLRELIQTYMSSVPFQSATLLSTPMEARHRPSLEEIKQCVLSGKGGLCYVMNVFFKYLLDALGYETFFVIGDIVYSNNHVLVIVVGLETPGDKFLVDAGIGLPTFDPIPLDFEKESKMYTNSFITYNFTWDPGSLLIKFFYQFKKSLDSPASSSAKKMCRVYMTPKSLVSMDSYFDDVYKNPNITPFHQSLRIFLYIKKEKSSLCIKDSTLIIEDKAHFLQEIEVDSADDLLEVTEKYCPLLKGDTAKSIEMLTLFS